MHYKTIVTNYTIHDVYLVMAIELRVMILLVYKCIRHICFFFFVHSGGGGSGVDDGVLSLALNTSSSTSQFSLPLHKYQSFCML